MNKWSQLVSELTKQQGSIDLGSIGMQKNPKFGLSKGDTVFTIGSCFARNIEDRLEVHDLHFPIKSYPHVAGEFSGPRPRGILNKFTPECMLLDIEWLYAIAKEGQDFEEQTRSRFLFALDDEKVIDLGLQEYRPVSLERFWQRRKDIYEIYKALFDSNVVILTLGLIEQWLYKGQTVQHAPSNKQMLKHRSDFSFKVLSDSQVNATLETIIDKLHRLNPSLKIIFTVSPVPLKSTFSNQHIYVANTLSKSRLVNGAHTMLAYDNVDYFPSYEIVSLIGNHAFEGDMRHVKDQVVQAISNYFARVYLG